MSSHPPGRTLVIALSAALACSLLVIAFLLGRESATPSVPSAVVVPEPPTIEEDVAEPVAPETEARQWPAWADLEEWVDEEQVQPTAMERTARIEKRPDGTLLLSNRQTPTAREPKVQPSSAGSSVTDYFLQMDLIRSEAGAGDPNAFAMDLIKAAMGGSTAGFDQLIDDTARMEAAARQITPPPACEAYHQANIESLAESRQVLESMKSALARRDIDSLTAIARNAQALQYKAEELKQMRKQITASAQ